MTKTVRCIGLEYQAGSYQTVQSYSRKSPGYLPSLRREGLNVRDRGTGWASAIQPSRLILTVETAEGGRSEVWVDWYFKREVGRLTAKRRDAIQAAMPKEINVEEKIGQRGTQYYSALQSDLDAWLSRITLAR